MKNSNPQISQITQIGNKGIAAVSNFFLRNLCNLWMNSFQVKSWIS
jgi:hypothetical protein